MDLGEQRSAGADFCAGMLARLFIFPPFADSHRPAPLSGVAGARTTRCDVVEGLRTDTWGSGVGLGRQAMLDLRRGLGVNIAGTDRQGLVVGFEILFTQL